MKNVNMPYLFISLSMFSERWNLLQVFLYASSTIYPNELTKTMQAILWTSSSCNSNYN
jgi:hypothetical protein